VKVAHDLGDLAALPRAVTVGTFDGVHRGHRRVVQAAIDAGDLTPTVVTFTPHPRHVLGGDVALLTTLERRLELLAGLGLAETLVLEFDETLARVAAEAFAEQVLRRIGAQLVVAGPGFRFGRSRHGDLALLGRLGFEVREVEAVAGVSSTAVRELLAAGDVEAAAGLLGRPAEVEGTVIGGERRGRTLGFPTANLDVPSELAVPANGIYAGAASGHRAAISIGVNPHYGGAVRRVEAFLLDFDADLYGQRLVLELWQRLRDELAFTSEQELVDQIARDVEQTRAAEHPLA
jgi:riboflavin kinase/FMN adenylyltransferase